MNMRSLVTCLLAAVACCVVTGCEEPPPEPRPIAPAVTGTLWRALGAWSGRGDRQTESFDVTSGSMRLAWEAADGPKPGSGHLRVTLHSAISGRPLQTVVDARGTGADTAYLGANPRVAYLLIESEHIDWHVTLEEGVSTTPGDAAGRE